MTGDAPLRILLAADFARSKAQRTFFSVERKLANGFIRLGHNVVCFSDRDTARESSLLRSSRRGAAKMNLKLVETARHYQPHVIMVGHADLVTGETWAALREAVKTVRLAQFNVDPTFRPKTMATFGERANHVDVSFITTGDAAAIRAIEPAPKNVHFFPNPVDGSVETARVFERQRNELELDLLFLGTRIGTRDEQIDFLDSHLAPDVRRRFAGGIRGSERISGLAFLNALATAAQNLNIPIDDRRPEALLYSSDRIALLLGQGTAAHTSAPARLDTLYDDGVLAFSSREELAENIVALSKDDERRRRIAQRGWQIAHSRTNSTRVAKYMLECLFALPLSEDYGWPTGPLS
ncbi:glycosyltransferase [Rhizobiaceae bacterium BDR2-2]|uniref:Glycosyltransferase n=1 Tax=Ectorhizobium quercum TaxID=2965071 RepID=A0AAE3MYC1_9HYPH|nr:glycosyltransferase [Ectorhizobium quercum]MCX8996541.1 glycosyltransferase [Ectorhizobium quercum]